MLILGVPIAVGTTILASKIILLIFGYEYVPSIIVLQILVWTTAFSFVGGVFANLFQSTNRQIISTRIVVISAILNVILNIALIPKYSYTGASIAFAATGFVGLALSFFWCSRAGYGIPVKNLEATAIRVL
jgi:O-antigen/teichoic acid export membrane protein